MTPLTHGRDLIGEAFDALDAGDYGKAELLTRIATAAALSSIATTLGLVADAWLEEPTPERSPDPAP